MNFKRIGRALVCLLLVCCLCFNMVTVPAKASVLGQTLWILGESVIASIIKGCGVHAGEEAADFNQVVSQCWEDIKADTQWYEWILGDEMMVNKFGSEADKVNYYVHLTLLETVRRWLFDSGTVYATSGSIPSSSEVQSYGEALAVAQGKSYYAIAYVGDITYICCTDLCAFYEYSYAGITYLQIGDYTTRFSYWSSESGVWKTGQRLDITGGTYNLHSGKGLGYDTVYDLTFGHMVLDGVDIPVGYSTWAANSVTVDAETEEAEDTVYYPVALGQTYEETVGMTQEDVWAGNSTYVEVTVDSEITADSVAATPWATFTQWISAGWADLKQAVLSIPDAFAGWFADVITGIKAIPDAITSAWDAAVAAVLAGIQSIFVPAEDFLTVKVDALLAEFPFIGPIIDVGKFIGGSLSGLETSPPIIYIDLGATRGSYKLGGKVAFIDMTWYAEYKPTVDMLLSALLWIVFWWKMFKRLPALISGLPGDFVMDGLNSIGLADHLPSRNAAYELQRQSIRESIRRGRK